MPSDSTPADRTSVPNQAQDRQEQARRRGSHENFSVKHARIEREMRKRRQLIIAVGNRRIESQRLFRLGGIRTPGGYSIASVKIARTKMATTMQSHDAGKLHADLSSRFDAGNDEAQITNDEETRMH